MVKCLSCQYEIKEERTIFCDNCWTIIQKNDQGEQTEVKEYLQFPIYDFPNSDSKESYEMRQIHPSGKNSTKYRWFICTPNFPAEQYKINDPHCHAWPDDRQGEARISLDTSTHEPTKFKVKWGKVEDTDQTEIKKLVKRNKDYIYEEWKKEWIK